MSEQDFFFDEEPEAKTPAPKAAASKSARPAAGGKPAPKATPVVEAPASSDQSTTWAVAVLIGVIGLLLGAILGFLLGTSLSSNSAVAPSTTTPPAASTGSGSGTPSTLTSEQINSGQLPAGHPPINTSGTADTTPTK